MAKGQQRKNKEASKQKIQTDEICIFRSHKTLTISPDHPLLVQSILFGKPILKL